MARDVVSLTMGVLVKRYEDGTANSQVDAVIEGEDGPAALEIIGDDEAPFNAQWDALEKVEHKVAVPELERVWSAQLARRARVRDVVRKLPALIVMLQSDINQGQPRLAR